MNVSALCPCCSDKLIHHIGHHRDYWFCRGCWQEMPLIDNTIVKQEAKSLTYENVKTKPFNSLKRTKSLSLKVSLQ